MINYEFTYAESSRPKILKSMTASSGETLSAEIMFEHKEDREVFTIEQVYEHLQNLLQYIKDTAPELTLIHMDEEEDGDGWHLNDGWGEIDWASNEILKWWQWAYYNDKFEIPESPEEPPSEEPA